MNLRPGKNFSLYFGIFLAAILVRVIYNLEIADHPAYRVLITDSSTYREIGRNIAGGTLDPRLFWQGMFYPLFLALLNGSIVTARVLQIILGGLSCCLVYATGARRFDRRTGLTAAGIMALYGPAIFFESEILATGWAIFFAALTVYILIRIDESDNIAMFLFAGLAGGLACITRPTFIPFFVAAGAYTGWRIYRNGKKRDTLLIRTGLLTAGFITVLLIIAFLSHKATGHFSAVPKSGTINLYLGNNPDTDSTMMIRPGAGWRALIREPEIRGSRSESEARRYFRDRFSEYVVTSPGGFIKGIGVKATQLLNSRELPRNLDPYAYRSYSKLLSGLMWKKGGIGFPFVLLLPLAVTGILFGYRKMPWQISLFLLLYSLSIIIVFVASRYRTVIVPVMAVPAASGALILFDSVRKRSWKRIGIITAIILCSLLLSALSGPYAVERYNYEAEMHASVGYELGKDGRLDEAYLHLKKAHEMEPEYAGAMRMLGNVCSQMGKFEEAAGLFEKALGKEPDSYTVHFYLGMTLLRLDRQGEAVKHFQAAAKGAREAREQQLLMQIQRILSSIEPGDG